MKFELEAEITKCEVEMRKLQDACKAPDAKADEISTQLDAVMEKRAKLIKEKAQLEAPEEKVETRSALFDAKEWGKLATGERRSLTIGNTGAINQIKQLFQDVADNDDILAKVSFFYGANASTNIPVLSALTDPAAYGEGATSVTADTDASLTVTSLTPKAHVALLPISAEALTMGIINLEAELPAIFQKAFAKVMHKELVVGSGTNTMTGIFETATGATVASVSIASNATAVPVSKLAELALDVSAKDEEYVILMKPSVYQGILSDSSSSEDIKLYKESLISDKTIEGVKVILDGRAPAFAKASGNTPVVAVPLSRYAVGVAGEIVIDPIKVKGDTNTYFQATMFFNGKQISAKDLEVIRQL